MPRKQAEGSPNAREAFLQLNVIWRLETKTQRQLNNAGIRSGKDLTERRAVDVRVGICKFRMVENIKELRAEFQLQALAVQRRRFRKRQVKVGSAGSSQGITRQRAVGCQ